MIMSLFHFDDRPATMLHGKDNRQLDDMPFLWS